MNMKIRNLFMLAVASMMLAACNPTEDITLMSNIDQIPNAALTAATTQAGDFSIKPGDMLMINVFGANEDAVKPFNKIQYVREAVGTTTGQGIDHSTFYYLVDDNGNIDFPILGRLHVSGMTKQGVEDYVTSLIYPRYLIEKPSVECRIQNFKVYCLGDFNGGGIIQAENGRLNLIEAIAMCHDIALTGQRENLLLVRTDISGQRTVKRFNLNDASFFSSADFQLQQNDILYVEPNKYKKRSIWSVSPMFTFGLGMMGTAMSLITFVTVLAKK